MSRRASAAVGVALGVVVLAGCTAGPDPVPSPETVELASLGAPTPVGTPAPEAEIDPTMLPYAYEESPAVAPGWSAAPLEADGVFVAPADDDAVVAVDAAGTVLWRTGGPEGTDVDLTAPDEQALAVLTAPRGDGTWTARAHDLITGQAAWGPVTWPGAPTGPGLVLETTGGLVAVDARSGEPLPTPDGATVVAERDGVVVHQVGNTLEGHRDGSARWTVTVTDLGLPADAVVAPVTGARTPAGTVLVGDAADGPSTGTLVDVQAGTVLAGAARAALVDELFDTLVVLGDGVLSGFDGDELTWSRPVPADARLTAVGGALAYLRTGDAVLAVNTATGADAEAYGPPGPDGFAVPAVTGDAGSAAMRTDVWVLLTAPQR